ncbi:MAG: tetratricopeptide repeat protein [Candidatus Omnitrophota bacterium]
MANVEGTFILEISKQDNGLLMSICEQKELASTIKHYSSLQVTAAHIRKLCRELVAILNKAAQNNPSDYYLIQQLKKNGQLLWDYLLTKEIKEKLSSATSKNLILSLDECLIDIPWELLYDGREFLCLKFNIGRVVQTNQQPYSLRYRSTDSVIKMLILVNPTDDLKSAYLEGVYIKNQLDSRRKHIKIDFKSTHIDTLYVKKNLRDYDIVHFAGHCEYDEHNSRNTGWVLSDGRFTTRDVLALSYSLHLPSLVFSNACYSAKTGEALLDINYQEKTYSLAAAFLFSGVRHYVGTIWQVEDVASLMFAREFYNELMRGRPVGESIRLGRLKLIEVYGLTDISWANYILYGDPNYVLFKMLKTYISPAGPRIKKRAGPIWKKYRVKFLIAVSLIVLLCGIYFYLPAKNPGTYFLFLESKEFFKQGDNQQVISTTEKIIVKEPGFLAAYPLIAKAYERMGNTEQALKYYFEYALYSQKKNDKKRLASAYIGIGWIYHLSGDYEKAQEFYKKILNLSKENNDKLNEAVALRKLAVWHIDKEDYDKALELLMKAQEINLERTRIYGHKYNLACDYFDIGLVFSNKEDYPAAKKFYKKSLELFKQMKLADELSDHYFNLGEIYLFEKDYGKALEYYQEGLKIDETHGNKPAIANDYNMFGELYLQTGNLEKAEESFHKSALLLLQVKNLPDLAETYHNLAVLYKQKKQKSRARDYYRKAQEIYRQINTPAYLKIRKELLGL